MNNTTRSIATAFGTHSSSTSNESVCGWWVILWREREREKNRIRPILSIYSMNTPVNWDSQ